MLKGKGSFKEAVVWLVKGGRRLPLAFLTVLCALEEEDKWRFSANHIGEKGRARLQHLGLYHALKGRGGLRESTILFFKGSLLIFSVLLILVLAQFDPIVDAWPFRVCFSLREGIGMKPLYSGEFSLHREDRRIFSLHIFLPQRVWGVHVVI